MVFARFTRVGVSPARAMSHRGGARKFGAGSCPGRLEAIEAIAQPELWLAEARLPSAVLRLRTLAKRNIGGANRPAAISGALAEQSRAEPAAFPLSCERPSIWLARRASLELAAGVHNAGD